MTDPARTGAWAMEVWSEWVRQQRERGWPRESCEVRALESRQAQTRLDGIARHTGQHRPLPMPKESRRTATSRIPPIDHARLGPRVNRLLLDLHDEGRWREALLLKQHALGKFPVTRAYLGLQKSRAYEMLRWGRIWIGSCLRRDVSSH